MKAWGVWVWGIGETQEDGYWYEDAGGIPYVFYHAGAALAAADRVVILNHTLISLVCEFGSEETYFLAPNFGRGASVTHNLERDES